MTVFFFWAMVICMFITNFADILRSPTRVAAQLWRHASGFIGIVGCVRFLEVFIADSVRFRGSAELGQFG